LKPNNLPECLALDQLLVHDVHRNGYQYDHAGLLINEQLSKCLKHSFLLCDRIFCSHHSGWLELDSLTGNVMISLQNQDKRPEWWKQNFVLLFTKIVTRACLLSAVKIYNILVIPA
jgi:hypothetical protein